MNAFFLTRRRSMRSPDGGSPSARGRVSLEKCSTLIVTRSTLALTPKGLEDSVRVSILVCGHNPEERWKLGKRRSIMRTEHRLEAYATLSHRVVDSPETNVA
jgi:hypothetical protein